MKKLRRQLGISTKELMSTKVLRAIETGEIAPDHLKAILSCRLQIAECFVGLLDAGITAAELVGNTQLARVLTENKHDEEGSGVNNEDSHADMRAEMAALLELPQTSSYAVEQYKHSINTLTQSGPYHIIGAITFLEFQIPPEFVVLKQGIKKVLGVTNIPYLTDHIEHDSTSHFPELLKTLDQNTVQELCTGIRKMSDIKKIFYETLS